MNAEKQYSLTRNVHIQYSHSRAWGVNARISIPLVYMPVASQIIYTIISYLYRINLLLKLCANTIQLPIVGSLNVTNVPTSPSAPIHSQPLLWCAQRTANAYNDLCNCRKYVETRPVATRVRLFNRLDARFTEAVSVRWTIS